MKLADLHSKLSKSRAYRDAYDQLGDAVIVAVIFRAAREAARLTRAELAAETERKAADIARIEDEFDFSDAQTVSLIADRLEGHLLECGVNANQFYVEGSRLADLKARKPEGLTGIFRHPKWRPAAAPAVNRGGVSSGLSEREISLLRRVAAGELSRRDAVRDLVSLGVQQPRAEFLISQLSE